MSPQFVAVTTIRIEVERITDEYLHVTSGGAAASSAVNISHPPCCSVAVGCGA